MIRLNIVFHHLNRDNRLKNLSLRYICNVKVGYEEISRISTRHMNEGFISALVLNTIKTSIQLWSIKSQLKYRPVSEGLRHN